MPTPRAVITGEFLSASTRLEMVPTLLECHLKVIILSRNPEQATESVAASMVVSQRIQVCEMDGICFLVKQQSNVDSSLQITKYVIRSASWNDNLPGNVRSF